MRDGLCRILFCATLLLLFPGASAQQLQHRPVDQNPRVVICRVWEAHVSRDPAAGLIIVSQRDKADAERFRMLLQSAQEGGAVEYRSVDGGEWRPASIVRLKSCFGRGLLILRAELVPPAEGSAVRVRFPVGTLKSR